MDLKNSFRVSILVRDSLGLALGVRLGLQYKKSKNRKTHEA